MNRVYFLFTWLGGEWNFFKVVSCIKRCCMKVVLCESKPLICKCCQNNSLSKGFKMFSESYRMWHSCNCLFTSPLIKNQLPEHLELFAKWISKQESDTNPIRFYLWINIHENRFQPIVNGKDEKNVKHFDKDIKYDLWPWPLQDLDDYTATLSKYQRWRYKVNLKGQGRNC